MFCENILLATKIPYNYAASDGGGEIKAQPIISQLHIPNIYCNHCVA